MGDKNRGNDERARQSADPASLDFDTLVALVKDLTAQVAATAEQKQEFEKASRKHAREVKHLKKAIEQEKMIANTKYNQHMARSLAALESERYLRLVLQNSDNIIILLDRSDRVAYCSNNLVAGSAVRPARDVRGLPILEVLGAFGDAQWTGYIRAVVEAARSSFVTQEAESRLDIAGSGISRKYNIAVTPMTNESMAYQGMLLLFTDVTGMEEAREKAEQASRSKGNFLSNMSHEMRTPMNAIIGMTQIGKATKDMARKDYAFVRIEEASSYLLSVINDILDMSKIEANKLELAPVHFSFRRMMEQIFGVFMLRLQEKNLHYSVNINSEVPDILYGDDNRIAQVFTNLLSNAVKFTPADGAITVSVALAERKKEAVILNVAVTDTGIGVTEEQKSRLFKSFEQAESGTARKYGGTGLGLAISKRIVELMGGTIGVESEEGKGATFPFTLALRMGDAGKLSQKQAASPVGMDFRGRTILLAEDVEINREIVVSVLEDSGLTIDCADNGAEAVAMFEAAPERYDLIFMDVQMPEMDGIEATACIRALDMPQARTIPIIAMTANVFRDDVDRYLAAGMNDHLGKPLDFQRVGEVLRTYMRV